MTLRKDAFADAVLLAGRILMSVEFVLFGSMKVVNNASMQGYMEAHGVPGVLVWAAIAVQIGAGLMLAFGLKMRWAALALAGFCFVATGIFHSNFADLREVSDFTKDLAAAGGLLVLALVGPGRWSLDALIGKPVKVSN
jgi:putative oxidoreductase